MARKTLTFSADQLTLSFEACSTDPFSAITRALTQTSPEFLPTEPATRMRGWGSKSILDESEDK